jgi:hypothetical protein
LVTPVPLSPLLLLCCAYGGGSIKISLQAMPYRAPSHNFVKKNVLCEKGDEITRFDGTV